MAAVTVGVAELQRQVLHAHAHEMGLVGRDPSLTTRTG